MPNFIQNLVQKWEFAKHCFFSLIFTLKPIITSCTGAPTKEGPVTCLVHASIISTIIQRIHTNMFIEHGIMVIYVHYYRYVGPLATISYLYVKVSRELQNHQSSLAVIMFETRGREGRSRTDSHSTATDFRWVRLWNNSLFNAQNSIIQLINKYTYFMLIILYIWGDNPHIGDRFSSCCRWESIIVRDIHNKLFV